MRPPRFNPDRGKLRRRVYLWAHKNKRFIHRSIRDLLQFNSKFIDYLYDDVKFRLYTIDNYTDRALVNRGRYKEQVEIEWLRAHFKGRTIVFVDIGANSGMYSLLVGRDLAPDSRILAVEPNPIMRARLETNVWLNKLKNVDVLGCAIADMRGQMRLLFPKPKNFGEATLHTEMGRDAEGVDVPVIPLLELMRDENAPSFDMLKIDVEGFEDRALAPFLESAPDHVLPEVMVIEHAHKRFWNTDLHECCERRGYKRAFENRENWIMTLDGLG